MTRNFANKTHAGKTYLFADLLNYSITGMNNLVYFLLIDSLL